MTVSEEHPVGQLFDPTEGNCPINEFDIPGEGLRIQGTTGGLVVGWSGFVQTASEAAQGVARLSRFAGGARSAILVVDDFGGNTHPLGVYDIRPEVAEELATVAPSDLEAHIGRLEESEQISHGALVRGHILDMLGALTEPGSKMVESELQVQDPSLGFEAPFTPFKARVVDVPDLGIEVVAIDTDGFDTEVIAGRIAASIQVLHDRVQRIAVNLSFGIVPCSVLENFEAAAERFPTFEEYQQAVLHANPHDDSGPNGGLTPDEFEAQLLEAIVTPLGGDPLYGLTERFLGKARVVYLAAAGNYAMDYALYPARWHPFVSIGASHDGEGDVFDQGSPKASYANTGEVLLPGGFYQLRVSDADGWFGAPGVGFAGTSFAAPVASAFTALDLRSAAPRCPPTSDGRSPLAFFDPAAPAPHPPLDVPLGDAVGHYCP